jgi:hypothetical protein
MGSTTQTALNAAAYQNQNAAHMNPHYFDHHHQYTYDEVTHPSMHNIAL